SQLRTLKNDTTFQDAKLFLYMIEGAIIQLLSSEQVDQKERLFNYFLNALA
ncbi:MAG TPA: TetR family transcriptional regulator, partial [Acinetobacter nosocomialis]|nr:TetR family transcriptional regulator [Acinetobacter nosocomialis]